MLSQIEAVTEWLAKMGWQASWISREMDVSMLSAAEARERWEVAKNSTTEIDGIYARKHRLIAMFRSADCYSANVHADPQGLQKLVDMLVRLDRLPNETPPEGLQLLVQAWDENRGKYEKWSSRLGPQS